MAKMINEWYKSGNPVVGPGGVTSGGLVLIVQTMINQGLGMTIHEDGEYGPETENAIKTWQYAHGLSQDGIVGPQTWNSFWQYLGSDICGQYNDCNCYAHYEWITDYLSPIYFRWNQEPTCGLDGSWIFQYGSHWIYMDDAHYDYYS